MNSKTILQYSQYSNPKKEVQMRRYFIAFLLVLFCFSVVDAQVSKNIKKANGGGPAVDIPITVINATKSEILKFGLDPTATDGLDVALGENELPPLPPVGTFDARFVDDPNAAPPVMGQGVKYDYKNGTAAFNGTKYYFIQCQVESGTTYKVRWDLPAGVTGVLHDVIGDGSTENPYLITKAMVGKDSLTVNKAYTTLKMQVIYALDSPSKYIITPSNLSPGAGSNITINAQLADGAGGAKAVAGKVVTWSKTGAGGSFATPTSTTDANGIATVTFTVGTVGGTVHTVTGTDAASLTGTSANINVGPGTPSKYKVTSSSYTPDAGGNVTISAQLSDQYDNNVLTAGKTVTWSKTGTGGSFANPTSLTDANGIATIVFTTGQTAATVHTVTATDNTTLTGTSSNITTKAGAAAKYLVTSNNYAPVAGAAVNITAQLADQYGNAVKTAGLTVTWSKTGAGGVFNPLTSPTDADGKAVTAFTTANTIGTTYVVIATDNNTLTGQTTNILTSAGPASKYIVTASRNTPVAGDTVKIFAQLADDGGNAKAEAGKVITWSSTNGGTFATPTSTTDANGKANVIFTTDKVAGKIHKAKATDNSTPTALIGESGDITTQVGPFAKLKTSVEKTSGDAGSIVKVFAQMQDANDNNIATAARQINWTKDNGTLGAANSLTNADGKAEVSLTLSNVAGTVHKVTATDNINNLITADAPLITGIAGPAHHYKMTVSSNNPNVGTAITVDAQLQDQFNNNVAVAGKIVTWSKTGTGGIFAPLTSNTDVNGKATVQFTVHTVAGTKHKVTATDNSTPTPLTGESEEITTKAGAGTKYIVTSSDYNPVAGSQVDVDAQFVDQYNNNVAELNRVVTWSSLEGGTFLAPTSNTDANGKATVKFTTNTIAGKVHKVTGTDAASKTGTSNDITTKAGPITKIVVTTPNASPKFGTKIIITAQLADVNNNPVKDNTKTIVFTSDKGTLTLPTEVITDTDGKATVELTVDGNVGIEHIITATDKNNGAVNGNLKVKTVAGPPTKYVVTVDNANPVAGDNVIVSAQLADDGNNPHEIADITVNWTFTGLDGVLSSSTSKTNNKGIATITFTGSKKAAVVHTVKAKDADNREGTSPNITTKAGVTAKVKLTVVPLEPVVGTKAAINAQLVDANDNEVKEAGRTINFTTDKGVITAPASFVTNADGKASAEITVTTLSGDVHKVTATDNVNNLIKGDVTFSTKSDVGHHYKVSVLGGLASSPLNSQIQLNSMVPITMFEVGSIAKIEAQLEDQYNNVVKLAGKTVAWSDLGDAGTFASLTSSTDANGLAKVDYTVNRVADKTHKVKALDNTSPTGLTGESIPFKTKVAAGDHYIVKASNYNPVVGTKISIEAQIVDKFDNIVKELDRVVTWSATNGGVLSAAESLPSELSQFSGMDAITSKTNANGIAYISLTVSQTAATIHNVTALDNLTKTGVSPNITTKADIAAKYIVTASSYVPVGGNVINVFAQLADKYGNFVKTIDKEVTWTSTNGGVFKDAKTKTDANGIAKNEFTTAVGIIHKITATDTDLFTGTSDEIKTTSMDAPTLLAPANNIEDISNTIVFSWTAVNTAEAYDLWIATKADFSSTITKYDDITDTKKEVVLSKSTQYWWKVRAKKGAGFGEWSVIRTLTTAPPIPNAPVLSSPANLAKTQPLTVELKWLAADAAKSYNVVVSEKDDFSKIIANQEVTVTKFNLTGLKNGLTYWWKVSAKNTAGTGNFSSVFSFTTIDVINAPSDLTAIPNIKMEVVLSWKDNSSNEKKFSIERTGENNDTYAEIALVDANVVTYTNVNLTSTKVYKYRVRAVNEEVISPYSNIATVTMPVTSVQPPAGFNVQPLANGNILARWLRSLGASGYKLFRQLFGSTSALEENSPNSVMGGYEEIASLGADITEYTDVNTTEGKMYNYMIVAFNNEGSSVPAVTEKPLTPLNAPQNLRVTKLSETSVKVSWSDLSSNEEGFELSRSINGESSYVVIQKLAANGTEFTDNDILDGLKYYYKVNAYNGQSGLSAFSNVENVQIAMNVPTLVVAAQLVKENKIKLTWTDNSKSETGYIIERKESKETAFKEVGRVTTDVQAFTDATVENTKTYSYQIKGYNANTSTAYVTANEVTVGIEREEGIPSEFTLAQNYPNPFNPSTVIKFSIPYQANVKVTIFNTLGQEVAVLNNSVLAPGSYNLKWEAGNLPSGIYFVEVNANGNASSVSFRDVKKMMLMK